jgi:uncharacterized membrane protein
MDSQKPNSCDLTTALRFACSGAFVAKAMMAMSEGFPPSSRPYALVVLLISTIAYLLPGILLFRKAKHAVSLGLMVLAGAAAANLFGIASSIGRPFITSDWLIAKTVAILIPIFIHAACLWYVARSPSNTAIPGAHS